MLDEPTNGLDPQGTREVRLLIRDLAAEGSTVLVSSHLLSEIEQVCSHVGVMSAGHLVAQGGIEQVRGAARTRVDVEVSDVEGAADLLRRQGLDGVRTDHGTVVAEPRRRRPRAGARGAGDRRRRRPAVRAAPPDARGPVRAGSPGRASMSSADTLARPAAPRGAVAATDLRFLGSERGSS
ncbi:hypothetical protein GCM10025868_17350 [Angustibacter aerolatus]|uniref:ATPase AAA-type core domain-containing protein n=1 Tax=Angustibacter aerolatus TaxID=1162965 RepID=A0ABQ6JI27_9ACTN|nr:hypothetical protein [Angustibacter aerolatus]GMA86485.1 hypothetical protein GCM10025868_17350 [Angustibacter aerolatus]